MGCISHNSAYSGSLGHANFHLSPLFGESGEIMTCANNVLSVELQLKQFVPPKVGYIEKKTMHVQKYLSNSCFEPRFPLWLGR